MEWTTPRLVLDAVTDHDIEPLTAVRASNPAHLARTEGTSGVPGLFDRSKMARDLAVAAVDPNRQILAIRTNPGGPPIGMLDLLGRHPDDECTWIGALVVHHDRHGHGFGREVVDAVVDWARTNDAAGVRAAVDEDDTGNRRFLAAVGMSEVERRWRRGPNGQVVVIVFERRPTAPGARACPP